MSTDAGSLQSPVAGSDAGSLPASPLLTTTTTSGNVNGHRESVLERYLQGAHFSANTIQEVFETQVTLSPDSIAVQYEEEQLTYRELNRRANRLAHLLLSCGISYSQEARTPLVAVCLERTAALIVALMAVLKAGAAYVPVDPSYPESRQRLMVQDSGAKIVLTAQNHHTFEDLNVYQLNIFQIDHWRGDAGVRSDSASEPAPIPAGDANLKHNVLRAGFDSVDFHPISLAPLYTIYTSGSTGNPKGVVGTHSNTLNRLRWMWQKFPFDPAVDVSVSKTSICFVDSIWEIFGSLLYGIKLVMTPQRVVKSTMDLLRVLDTNCISRLVLVPSLLQVLLETPKAANKLWSIKLWITSGESIQPGLLKKFEAVLGEHGPTMLNLYGSSEVAADATYFDCSANIDMCATTVPIGVAIPNIQAFVLNSRLEQVPAGAVGDLYVAGVGLANGYLERAGMTADRFLPNPFWTPSRLLTASSAAIDDTVSSPFMRMYRTGDVCKVDLNGPTGQNLIFMDRADSQVKIRGIRIELGEIEACLSSFAGIRECAVVTRSLGDGASKQLVAYYTSQPNVVVVKKEVRRHLKASLPAFMVPSHIVVLASFPLLPNGKLDRLSLPTDILSSEQDYEAPTNEIEEALCQIWKDVLHIDRPVGVRDNFFELGGDSIMSIQVVSRAYEAGINISTRQLLRHPTIRELAPLRGPSLASPGGRNSSRTPTSLTSPRTSISDYNTGNTGGSYHSVDLDALAEVNEEELEDTFSGRFRKGSLLPLEDANKLETSLLADENVEDIYPLTPMQQGMLFHVLLNPRSGEYITQMKWTIASTNFRHASFKAAWAMLIDRHPILRTSFIWEGLTSPVQLVHRTGHLFWTDMDWRSETGDHATRLRKLLEDDVTRGIDISAPSLQRFMLIRQADDMYEFIWTHHHLYLDGWSMAIVVSEIIETYLSDWVTINPRPSPPLYSKFIRWLTKQAEHEKETHVAEKYWRSRLVGFTAPTPVPLAKLAPSEAHGGPQSTVVERHIMSLSMDESRAVSAFAKRNHFTLHTLVEATWALILSIHSREEDVVFGTTVSGRATPNFAGIDLIVGMTINSLPVRVKVDRSMKVHQWLKNLQKANFKVSQYEHTALATVQSYSEIPKGTNMFDTIVVFENYPAAQADISEKEDVDVSKQPDFNIRAQSISEKTNFPIGLMIDTVNAYLQVTLMHNVRYVGTEEAAVLLAQFKSILLSFVRSESVDILGQLPLVVEPTLSKMCVEWNQSAVPMPASPSCILDAFEQQAFKYPDSSIIVAGDDHITMRELNERANMLAHWMRAHVRLHFHFVRFFSLPSLACSLSHLQAMC